MFKEKVAMPFPLFNTIGVFEVFPPWLRTHHQKSYSFTGKAGHNLDFRVADKISADIE